MENPEITIQNDIFYYFVRKNFVGIKISNQQLDDLKPEFEKYLADKNLKPEALALIMPRHIAEILMDHKPTYIHGFHPAFVLHFHEFIKEQTELANQEEAKSN